MQAILCPLFAILTATGALADDWPQWRGPQGDGVWRETGIIDALPDSGLTARWRMPIASGYNSPTVAEGRVYVMDRLTKPKQIERVHCFDAASGEALWSYEYARDYRDVGYTAGPRASVVIHEGLAYALGAMGDLHVFSAATGKIVWQRDLNAEYAIRMPVWGIAAAPVIYGESVIVHIGGEGACLVAFDHRTGEERWRALDDQASYSTPIIIEQAGQQVLVVWTGEHVVGLDPVSGKVHWQHAFPPKQGIISVASPVFAGSRLFLTNFFDGSLMLKLPPEQLSVTRTWYRVGASEQKTDGLHSIITTPLIIGEYIYGIDSYGEFRCLEAATGARVWEDQTVVPRARWGTAHLTPQSDKVWIFNERGDLLLTSLSPEGVTVHGRAHLIDPTRDQLNQRGGVTWSHPAYANRHVFVRNDEELACFSLAAQP
ncbi:MAG TPA: dehydrogenase [Candidatus Latescibacteria bacterium]|nr:dehydrogenase [Candidatus Handelsmanbacteria bacterium]HIL11770.1 dehydrogenase [Candidatus Latescibacterota bacterium]